MNTVTIGEALARHNIDIPPHLEAAMHVETATQGWRQGDVYCFNETGKHTPIGDGTPVTGVKVVQGDADRNSHILDCEHPDARWHPGVYRDRVADYGLLVVPVGAVAYLTHTSEHGSVALAEGEWRIYGQVSYEEELRRAAD